MTKEESRAATVAMIAKDALFNFYLSTVHNKNHKKKDRALLAKEAAELFIQAIEPVLKQYEDNNG